MAYQHPSLKRKRHLPFHHTTSQTSAVRIERMSRNIQEPLNTVSELAMAVELQSQRLQLTVLVAKNTRRIRSLMLEEKSRLGAVREELESMTAGTALLTRSIAVLESRAVKVDQAGKDEDQEEQPLRPEESSAVRDNMASPSEPLSRAETPAISSTNLPSQLAQQRAITNENIKRIETRIMEVEQRLAAGTEDNDARFELASHDLERYTTVPEAQPARLRYLKKEDRVERAGGHRVEEEAGQAAEKDEDFWDTFSTRFE